ncbi:endo-beta-1,3-glucanase [bacterium]|nr:endo-beta-1,3-glucanase [bacterium]
MLRFIPFFFVLTAICFAQATGPEPSARPNGEEMSLVFADDFDGDQLNWNVWESSQYGEGGMKRGTLRGPENLEVRDGNLLLHIRKEQREYKDQISEWTAAYVYTKEPLDNNVYVESRFKSGAASGVNNAFWLACVTAWKDKSLLKEEGEWRDRYEVDIVEARKNVRDGDNIGAGHLAWHDWKSYNRIKDEKETRGDIAQGLAVPHTWNDYHVWGLWYGENEMIWYLDGQELWRGQAHGNYPDQWWTGIGKFPLWSAEEEKRAYGKFGQADWSYNGGYTGDRQNIIFSNLPWGDPWTPLTDEADGTFMAIDYVRVYKPVRLLTKEPNQVFDPATYSSVYPRKETFLLPPGRAFRHPLSRPVEPSGKYPSYFSLLVKKDQAGALRMALLDASDESLAHADVNADGSLAISIGQFEKTASTATAWPASERKRPFVADGDSTLLVLRLTPNLRDGKTAISLSAFPWPPEDAAPLKEPHFYGNIDNAGNTSANNHWDINLKGLIYSDIAAVRFESVAEGHIYAGAFRLGVSFQSVLPETAKP